MVTILLTFCNSLALLANAELTQPKRKAVQQIAQSDLDCSKVSNNVELLDCSANNQIAAENEMNEVFNKIIGKVADDEATSLKEQQQNWLNLRNSQCEDQVKHSRSGGGTLEPIAIHFCETKMTKDRTIELQNLYNSRWGQPNQ